MGRSDNEKVIKKSYLSQHLTGSKTPTSRVRVIEQSRWEITESQMSDLFWLTG